MRESLFKKRARIAHVFYELSLMVIRKNVNNDFSKDSPIGVRFREMLLERDLTVRPGL